MNSKVDAYLGKENKWQEEMVKLRMIILDCQLTEEFQNKLDEFPELKTAFDTLTPGRQREYNLYFSAPKQSKTLEARVEKCVRQILNGKVLSD
jgi:uncharacterized protein YdeI (YjbR/CyaY-like superfamily)